MIEINGKQLCENCFEEITGDKCGSCGFAASDSVLDQSLLTAGSVLSNRYVIGQVIGKGGFGTTYLAYDALVCRKIAIKEYFPYGIAQRTSENADVSVLSEDNAQAFELGAEKFYNEAKLVSRFNGNPNIVAVYDCFYENNTVYMAMEYLSGRTLKEYIRENGVLSVAQALYVAKNVVGALVVAHSASILHRDISPDNIIVCDDGNIKLIDFGAARQVVAEHSQSFSVILKPGYAPPEQYSKKGNQGAWTDVYSVGTTLYYMVTGDIPDDPTSRFDNDDTFEENRFDISPALWEVITRATKLKAEDRYQDAYELKKALDSIPVAAKPLVAQYEAQDESGELTSNTQESRSELKVSIKKQKPKQNFWRKHRRTFIEAVCGLLVVALIVPLAIKAYTPIVVEAPPSGNSDASQPTNSGSVAAIGNKPSLEDINYTAPLYDGLDKADKQLYSDIYYGLIKDETQIIIDTLTYTIDDIDYVHSCVLNEHPELVHTRGYNVNYNDLNNNK
ncbi:MAG: serine/threonine protein kinase [Oscillospiraceae bacterium]